MTGEGVARSKYGTSNLIDVLWSIGRGFAFAFIKRILISSEYVANGSLTSFICHLSDSRVSEDNNR